MSVESEKLKQLNGEEVKQLKNELKSLRSDNEKMKKMLSIISKMNDLFKTQMSKCECNQAFDTKLNTKLNILNIKYEELKYEIDIEVNNRLKTQMIVIKNNKSEPIEDHLSEDDLNHIYNEDNNDISLNSNISEEIDNKDVKTENRVNSNVNNNINKIKTIGNEINLCHNYADIETNYSIDNNESNSDNNCDESEDECEYSCEFSDSKSGLLCEKKFTTQESLLNHVIRHSGQRPWFCDWPQCRYKAVQRNHLVGHMRKSHTGRFQFNCDWPGCDFRGPSRYNVKRHRIIHTGEKPYKCDWPGCDFRSPNNKIAAHKRIHTGERPYACNWVGCDARFSRPFTLRNHERTHTGDKPFVCDYPHCNYRSTQQTPLATHKRKHHSLGNVASEEIIMTDTSAIDLIDE